MKRSLGFLLAVAAILPGAAVTAEAGPITDSCFATTGGALPGVASAYAQCAEDDFDLLARSSSSIDVSGPTRADASFTKWVDPSGLSEVEVRVSIRFDQADATIETWAGTRTAFGEVSVALPQCQGCSVASARRMIVSSESGVVEAPGEQTIILRSRPDSGSTFYEPAPLSITVVAAATAGPTGWAETTLRGTITSIAVGAPPSGPARCATETFEAPAPLAPSRADAWCDETDSTFGTTLRASNIVGYARAESSIKLTTVRTLAQPAPYAIFSVDYVLTKVEFTPGGVWPFPQGGYSVAGVSAKATGPVYVRSSRASRQILEFYDEPPVGPGTLRVFVEPAAGTMLPAGEYRLEFAVDASAYTAILPVNSSAVDIEGALRSVTLTGA